MAAITIDDAAKFVCMLTFNLSPGDVPSVMDTVRRAVEQLSPKEKGFIGAVVMVNEEKRQLLVFSIWESGHDWSVAQYDQEVGRAVSEVVETAKSYEIQTYETVSVVRA